ncbi:LytR C-terminal domain-containing protein [Kitasatospora camelliae]|uniref:LytR C-terminal domain-containing protein n=1 Tax=Kitasatospora camelliae TaxID=3156397 RepID=A0AAU8K6Y4_9ACTN
MLTPQGLKGKQYRITGNSYPRLGRPPRRSRRIAVLIGSLLALSLIALGGVQLVDIFNGRGKNATAQACASPSASGKPLAAPAGESVPSGAATPAGARNTAVPQPQNVTVNVYNATATSGLAARTADELKKRGFAIGTVGNAPTALDRKVPGPAQVISGPAGAGSAVLLAAQVAGSTATEDSRTDATVDLVIGDAWTAVLDPTAAAAALAEATKPSPTPSVPGSC